MLEDIINAGKKFLVGGALMLAAGCSMYFPINKPANAEGGFKCGMEYNYVKPDLSKEQRYVPVHEDDGGAAMGGVELDELKHTGMDLFWGIEMLIGDRKDWKFKFGLEETFYIEPDWWDDPDLDNFDRELQPLPSPYRSYGYNYFDTAGKKWEPYLGFDFNLDNIKLGIELGFPYMEFSYERGHYRWSSYEPIEKGSWKGFGRSLKFSIGPKFNDGAYVGGDGNPSSILFYYGIEQYPARFGEENEILTHNLGLMYCF